MRKVINSNKQNHFDVHNESNTTLLLYIHGGGFFVGGSTSCEIYLRDLCNQLGGVPILSIDYSLTVPYPVPNQEVLDVYLWLLSGDDDVKEKLGFHPKKIIISGDSAGGFLCFSLTIALNELNKLIEDENNRILMPKAIVAAYPVVSIGSMTISKTQCILEPMIEMTLLLVVFSMYGTNLWSIGDFKKVKDSERYKQIEAKNKVILADKREGIDYKAFKPAEHTIINDSSPWFQCDYPTFKDRCDYINSFFDHSIVSPLLYGDKFDELKKISLYVFAGNLDQTIDDCIEIARVWKGDTCLDTFDDIIHGFLMFNSSTDKSREAFQLVISRFQEACLFD